MHKNVELLIGRLATHSEFRRRFAAQPQEALRGEALELTEVEIAAIAATDPEALASFAATLDPRLRKTPLANASPTTSASSEAAPQQENSR